MAAVAPVLALRREVGKKHFTEKGRPSAQRPRPVSPFGSVKSCRVATCGPGPLMARSESWGARRCTPVYALAAGLPDAARRRLCLCLMVADRFSFHSATSLLTAQCLLARLLALYSLLGSLMHRGA